MVELIKKRAGRLGGREFEPVRIMFKEFRTETRKLRGELGLKIGEGIDIWERSCYEFERILLLVDRETYIGYAIWKPKDQYTVEITELFIRKGWRDNGFGNHLFGETLKWAKGEYGDLDPVVDIGSNNTAMLRIAANFGFNTPVNTVFTQISDQRSYFKRVIAFDYDGACSMNVRNHMFYGNENGVMRVFGPDGFCLTHEEAGVIAKIVGFKMKKPIYFDTYDPLSLNKAARDNGKNKRVIVFPEDSFKWEDIKDNSLIHKYGQGFGQGFPFKLEFKG